MDIFPIPDEDARTMKRIIKKDTNEVVQRAEAWWNGDPDAGPLVAVTAPLPDAVPYSGPTTDELDAWWTDPDYVIPRLEHQLTGTFYGGAAMPVIFPVATGLVAITCKYLGAPNRYIDRNTSWSDPIIEDWATRPLLNFDENNLWWRKSRALLEAGVELIRSKGYEAFVGIPDLNGPTEVLAGLRGTQKLAMDFYDNPEDIRPALREVQDAWFEAFNRSSAIANRCGGHYCWMRVPSQEPMIDLQSDVSCLLSKEMFDEHFLPFIREQAERIDRTIYHLDGPGAIRHLDSLLEIDSLDGIQWVQGAGAGRMSEWIDLCKRILVGGKLLHVACDPDEVEVLCRSLDSSRMFLTTSAGSKAEAESLLATAERAGRR